MAEWKIPGLAIAVIRDGEVILAKGYGHRNVEEQLPVTSETLFAIGSNSKSFTVTVLGTLVDEGKLDWGEPVRTYLPDFRLYDPVASEQMTARDLVTHRSGLPRHDALWYGADWTREQMYQRLRYLEPSREFRSAYQYQNLMFMTAGYLAGKLAATSWEELVRQRIFQPLDMTRSNLSVDDSQNDQDFALPYGLDDEEVREIPFRNIDEIGPAGSINSSVEEMIRYVQMHIDEGKVGDRQLFSASNARQMQTPQMVIPGAIRYDELGHSSYGMGLSISTYRGEKIVGHGGGIDGFISQMSWMPRRKIGMVVLTNLSGNNPVPTIVVRYVYDRLLGLEPVDWIARIKEDQERAEEARAEAESKGYERRREGTSPSHALEEYTGVYEHTGYGAVEVEVAGDGLEVSFNSATAQLSHYHYDIFRAEEDEQSPLSETMVVFLYDKAGRIDRLTIGLEPNVEDIVFSRAADPSMRDRAFLEPFVGEYELPTGVATVAFLGDDTLTLTIPGQPVYKLVPVEGTTFDLDGVEGISVEFKADASGAVTEMVVYQRRTSLVAPRR